MADSPRITAPFVWAQHNALKALVLSQGELLAEQSSLISALTVQVNELKAARPATSRSQARPANAKPAPTKGKLMSPVDGIKCHYCTKVHPAREHKACFEEVQAQREQSVDETKAELANEQALFGEH